MPHQRETTRRQLLAGVATAGVIGALGTPARAQSDLAGSYPAKPIRIVVGFGPGGVQYQVTGWLGRSQAHETGPDPLVKIHRLGFEPVRG